MLFWLTFWPAAPLAALAAPAVWAERRERPAAFLLAWLVPSWIVFELVVTKLPHYVLPLYPAIAILIARSLWHGTLAPSVWLRRLTPGVAHRRRSGAHRGGRGAGGDASPVGPARLAVRRRRHGVRLHGVALL